VDLNLHHPADVSAAWPRQGGGRQSMRGRNTMQATTRNNLAVVAAGMAAGLVVWAVVRLLGVELTVESGSGTAQVDVVDVLVATLADGISAVSLICMHLAVGVVLITGFMRAVPNPYWVADGAAGQRWHRG
jgi:Family of unknown function (DUF6069)